MFRIELHFMAIEKTAKNHHQNIGKIGIPIRRIVPGKKSEHPISAFFLELFGYGSKLGTPKLWMVNTKLDIHICGPLGLPFWPTSI